MQVILRLDGRTSSGGSPLVMHNERLADPLDDFTRAIASVSKKQRKTIQDHEEIAYLEFLGGLYTDPPLSYPLVDGDFTPALPAWNVLRCLQDGGRRHKRGMDVPRGIYPLAEYATLGYVGPRDVRELWAAGEFSLRKSVGVQRSRTMRTRPMFVDWMASLRVEVDPNVFDVDSVQNIWRDAGTYAGLGEMRPIYGRFVATVEVVTPSVEPVLSSADGVVPAGATA